MKTVTDVLRAKPTRLFVVLGGFFIANALIAEFIGVKIFALEASLGYPALNWNLFGETGSLNLTAGVLLWPIVFIMTDIINEYFGVRGVRLLSIMAAGLIAYGFGMVFWAISLAPAEWWPGSMEARGVPDMQAAFGVIFGQGNWIIIGSLIAFLVGQLADAMVFKYIRKLTGDKRIWLRATVSTLFSQFIDSFVVLYVAFVLGPAHWEWSLFLAVGTVNYAYKVVMAILLLPLIYVAHYAIDRYLGRDQAEALRATARGENP